MAASAATTRMRVDSAAALKASPYRVAMIGSLRIQNASASGVVAKSVLSRPR